MNGSLLRSTGDRSTNATTAASATFNSAATTTATTATISNGHAIITELSRRVVASILLATGATDLGAPEILFVLSDLLTLSLLRMLRSASLRAQHAHRHVLNIFDVLPALGSFHLDAHRLLEWARFPGRLGRAPKTSGSGRGPMLVPLGRSLLKSLGDEDEDEDVQGGTTAGASGSSSLSAIMDTGGIRPAYLLDIYPPFPRSYTFRRTETKGMREGDKVLIAKAKAEQQRQMESNLYRLLSKTSTLPVSVNWDEGNPRDGQITKLPLTKRRLSGVTDVNRS